MDAPCASNLLFYFNKEGTRMAHTSCCVALQYMNCNRFIFGEGDGIITMKSTTTIPIMANVTRQAGA